MPSWTVQFSVDPWKWNFESEILSEIDCLENNVKLFQTDGAAWLIATLYWEWSTKTLFSHSIIVWTALNYSLKKGNAQTETII